MTKFRGFIGIDIKVTSKILKFEKEILQCGADVKLVEPENTHITLKFLGDTNEKLIDNIEIILRNTVKEIKPFTIQLVGTGVFPNSNYIKIVWIGLKNWEILKKIQDNIDKKLSDIGFKKEKRNFSPHLTIGRLKSARGKEKILMLIDKYREIKFTDDTINQIKLKKSELTPNGPIYTDIKIINFGE